MLSVIMLSVSIMNVVMLSVVPPLIRHYGKLECLSLQKLVIFVTCKLGWIPSLDWSPTRAGSNLACKFKTRLKMSDRDKRSSLPWYRSNYHR